MVDRWLNDFGKESLIEFILKPQRSVARYYSQRIHLVLYIESPTESTHLSLSQFKEFSGRTSHLRVGSAVRNGRGTVDMGHREIWPYPCHDGLLAAHGPRRFQGGSKANPTVGDASVAAFLYGRHPMRELPRQVDILSPFSSRDWMLVLPDILIQ